MGDEIDEKVHDAGFEAAYFFTRGREKDRGKALAGKSTLNRMELSGEKVAEGERLEVAGSRSCAGC